MSALQLSLRENFICILIDPFKQNAAVSAGKDDEIFIQLKDFDETFEENIRNYAAAKELSLHEVQQYKTIYNQLAQKYQKVILNWLRENIASHFQISYKSSTKLFKNWASSIKIRELSGISGSETLTFKQQLDTLASGLYADHFSDQKPDYPKFSIKITNQNRRQTVQEALKAVVKTQMTGQAMAVLTALDLLSGTGLSIDHSSVCSKMLEIINDKATGQVVNRNELVFKENDREYIVNTHLEVDFLPVFLAVLINEGYINMSIGSERINRFKF